MEDLEMKDGGMKNLRIEDLKMEDRGIKDEMMKDGRIEDGGMKDRGMMNMNASLPVCRNLPDATANDFSKVDLHQFRWIHWEVNQTNTS